MRSRQLARIIPNSYSQLQSRITSTRRNPKGYIEKTNPYMEIFTWRQIQSQPVTCSNPRSSLKNQEIDSTGKPNSYTVSQLRNEEDAPLQPGQILRGQGSLHQYHRTWFIDPLWNTAICHHRLNTSPAHHEVSIMFSKLGSSASASQSIISYRRSSSSITWRVARAQLWPGSHFPTQRMHCLLAMRRILPARNVEVFDCFLAVSCVEGRSNFCVSVVVVNEFAKLLLRNGSSYWRVRLDILVGLVDRVYAGPPTFKK